MQDYWKLIAIQALLFAMVPMSVGVAAMLTGWQWNAEATTFVEQLQHLEGQIEDMQLQADGLHVRARYYDADGVEHTKEFVVDESQQTVLQSTGVIGLVYDGKHAKGAEVGNIGTASNERMAAVALLGAGMLGFFGGLGYLGRHMVRIARLMRLFGEGQIVETEVRDQRLKAGGAEGRFSYAFRGPDGRWYEGASQELPERELRKWTKATPVHIVYDPEAPRHNEPDIFRILEKNGRIAPSKQKAESQST